MSVLEAERGLLFKRMTQQVKGIASKLDDLNSIPTIVEEDKCCMLSSNLHAHNKCNKTFFLEVIKTPTDVWKCPRGAYLHLTNML